MALEDRIEPGVEHYKVSVLARLNFPRPREHDLDSHRVVDLIDRDASSWLSYREVVINKKKVPVNLRCDPNRYT